MILPSARLLRLLAWGAPLWFLTIFWSGLALVPLAWIAGLLGLAFREARSAPQVSGLAVSREVPKKLAYVEPSTVKIGLTNLGERTLHLMVRDEAPDTLDAESPIFECSLEPASTFSVSYPVEPYQRGVFPYGDVVLRAQWDRRLVEKEMRVKIASVARVYPRFRGSSNYELLARIAQRDEALRPRRLKGQGSDYESLQLYVPGNDPRCIEWKSSARRGTLICRNPQVEKGQHLAILVDSGRLMAASIEGHSRLEHALEAAVRLSYVVQKRGDTLSLSVFSNQVEKFVPKLRKHSILPTVLEALCGVEQRSVESDYWRITAQVLSSLRQRSLVVLFTHILDAAGSKGLIRNLRRAASRHLVLCVILTDPELATATQRRPGSVAQAWEVAAACDLARRRRLALEQMKSYGILILESPPKALNHNLIRRYLEIRRENLQ